MWNVPARFNGLRKVQADWWEGGLVDLGLRSRRSGIYEVKNQMVGKV